ncbi:MAG: hypothetical protein KDA89_19300 [Planctomycetaceae bacterium]|nr:hypothetical protein [Planctomycetaceae bacterium]
MTPLHAIGDQLRFRLAQVPLTGVRVLFVMTLVLLLIWVLRLPPSVTRPQTSTSRRGENLKFPAAVAVLIQILIYVLL